MGILLAARFVEVVSGREPRRPAAAARDRSRAVEAALRIDDSSHEPIDLESVAAEVTLTTITIEKTATPNGLDARVLARVLEEWARRRGRHGRPAC